MKKDEFYKIIEENNRKNKFYNKSVDEKKILLVEYLLFDEKKKYEELKKYFEKIFGEKL